MKVLVERPRALAQNVAIRIGLPRRVG